MTAAVLVMVGLEEAIALAMVVSLHIVQHSYHPHSDVLIAEGSGTWKLVQVAPGVVKELGLALYLFGAPLFYANADRYSEEVSAMLQPMRSATRWVVVDAEAMTHMDSPAARVNCTKNRKL